MKELVYGKNLFVEVGTKPYTRKDGTETFLRIWEGKCRRCGKPFRITTPHVGYEKSCAFGRVHCDEHKKIYRVDALGKKREA